MKFFIATLLASFVSTIKGTTSSVIEARWKMDEPVISYDPTLNLFTADFPTASTQNVVDTGMDHIFFGYDCQNDGTGNYEEYRVPAGITSPDGGALAMTMDGPGGKPQLKFRIDTLILANDDNIYSTTTTPPF